MANPPPRDHSDPDPLVDLRIRVRSSFRKTLRLAAVDRNVALQTYAGTLLKRGYKAEQRSGRRRKRRAQAVPGADAS